MEFHTKIGHRATLSDDKRSARRENFNQKYDGAIVFSSVPLEDDFLFEVTIEEKATSWNNFGGLVFGITSQRPDSIGSLPENVLRVQHSWLFSAAYAFTISNEGIHSEPVYFGHLNGLNVGDSIGVMRKKSTGALHVYVNGDDKGSAFSGIPSGCYAVLDVRGNFVAVSVMHREAIKPGMVSIDIGPWNFASLKKRLLTAADLSKATSVKTKQNTTLPTSPNDDDAYIPSARFTHKSLPGFDWFLKLYPKGYCNESNGYVSVELCVEKSSKKSSATAPSAFFSASLTSAKGETHSISSKLTKFVGSVACVIEKFATHEKVERMCAADGSITLLGKIVIDPPFSSQHAEYLRRCYESGDFSDFKIAVENEPVEFAVHRNILSEASPFFKAMFHSQFDEVKEGKVTIRESSLDAVKAVLQYIYGDSLCFDGLEELSIYVLKLAEQYDLCGLKEVCEKVLTKMISKENVLEFAQIADLCSAAVLKKTAFQFICDNTEIMTEDTWVKFRDEKEKSKLVIEILEFVIAKLLDTALKK